MILSIIIRRVVILSIISNRVVILSKVSNLYRNSKALSKACLSKIKPDLEDA